MADTEWKKRLGIRINYSSGEDDDDIRVEYRIKNPTAKSVISVDIDEYQTLNDEDIIAEELAEKYEEQFGSTPPRTRIKIKNRDWERKQKSEICAKKMGCNRLTRSRVQRRNTMDCAILNQMFIDEDFKKADKRAQALLRESERDLKQSMAPTITSSSAINYSSRCSKIAQSNEEKERRIQKQMTSGILSAAAPVISSSNTSNGDVNKKISVLGAASTLVECNNRYMSVSSRPVGCRASAPASAFSLCNYKISGLDASKLQSRKEFHETFANLIKLGSVDRQDVKLSHEDYTWQTELQDLIWLELQAWQADRTLEQQDRYLFTARQSVPDLLDKILNYKFFPKYKKQSSLISTDSGHDTDNLNDNLQSHCIGCYSMYCKDCNEQQSCALKEVEELLTRLEAAEALYPSSQAMASFHPIYKCDKFVGRVKAMCLWYNLTRHHRLKLLILGKFLSRLQGSEDFYWPIQADFIAADSSSSSAQDNDDSGHNSIESRNSIKYSIPKVKFNLEGCSNTSNECNNTKAGCISGNICGINSENQSPSESVSSNDSTSVSSFGPTIGDYIRRVNEPNWFNVEPLANVTYDNSKHSTKLYRKYIENVLKSRGLAKSLAFLHRLHTVVLFKAQISLEKFDDEDENENEHEREVDFNSNDDDLAYNDSPISSSVSYCLEPNIDIEQIHELKRYGIWSPEAKSLGLPSYVPAFLFLSVIPLEVIHEFLRMRLETRPLKPNPLSLEQLMKELREGLTLALTHRERFHLHITTALAENEIELEKYLMILEQFDSTIKKVLELYLDYVDQWVLVAAPETHQKSALEKEWTFTKLVSPMIPGMHTMAAKKFCLIIRNLLYNIGNRLIKRTTELDEQIDETAGHDDVKKWQLLTICRETQALFTIERERSVKVLFFAKTFSRDVEQSDFHREHFDEYTSKELFCPNIKEAFKLLQNDVLGVRNKLMKIIERVQERCDVNYIKDMDEQDKQAVMSRTREILHQGYKFGFEYNKDVIRLFEQKSLSCKTEKCNSELAVGIIKFAKMWMQFVMERCERGRGVRPRWATQGLEFLILACDPSITCHLNEKQFEELKLKMDCCISHVIGIVSEPDKMMNNKKKPSPRNRKTSSPVTSRSRTPTRSTTPVSAGILPTSSNINNNKFLHPQFSLKETTTTEQDCNSTIDTPDAESKPPDFHITLSVPKLSITETPALRQIRVRDAVNRLDMEIENKLREKNLIGQVKTLNSIDKVHIRARSVNFRWHRGIKIGQGRFGKVYTAVNNSTGELMAMKEIPIQPGETRAIKKVAEELKILEGISHSNLVRYYGIEIHREELLIFMELCSEGTLESLVELSGGLHEGLTRRYTAQLLSGVVELHKHGIVHRDIKSANIFLVDSGNSLKLGDFGSAVKIQAHTTVPGELQGYVGTQAYMAPEVFTKTDSDGHGRAADIWSVGCVVIEMASGKRPWSQFDSNFQIMFKVGMGETPAIPDSLSQEGIEFVENCLQHDPKKRLTASELLQHNFCKVGIEEEKRNKKHENQGRKSLRRRKKI